MGAKRHAIKLLRRALGLSTDDLDIIGRLDGVDDGVVHGWAYRPAQPGRRVLVDIFADDVFVGERLADMRRDDLAAHGMGDGRHGFDLKIPTALLPGEATRIRVLAVAETKLELRSTQKRALFARRLGRDDYLRALFAKAFAAGDHAQNERPAAHARAFHATELLFAPTPVPAPPPILGEKLCAYLDHNRYKWDLADKFDTTVSTADREAFLAHYVEFYGRARRPLRIPLSARDIEFLNDGPAPDDRLAPSRAMRLFAEAPSADATDAERLDAIFRWAAFGVAAYNVEDCLVAETHAELLRSCDAEEAALRFPLSTFMKRFLAAHPILRGSNLAEESERRSAYFASLLFAARAPHYLRFVPPDWLDAFLSPQSEGLSPFEEESRRLFGVGGVDVSRWRAAIEETGYDYHAKSFRSRTPSGHRAHSVTLPAPTGETVDIQLIGPFSRQLGIADSCRALAAALELLDHSVRLCDFALDYPNRIRADAAPLSTTPARAKINILHLNLEELPSAIAYLPDVWPGGRLVAFPYLEMPAPHPAQMLGLTLVDEFWSASDFTTRALADHRPTYTVGSSLRPVVRRGREAARAVYDGLARADDFVFLASCDALSGAYRKNPLGTIRAFLAAFPDEARAKLVIKTHSVDRVRAAREMDVWRSIRNVAAECERIVLLDRMLDDEEQMALIEGADCYVSLHRAEGFGYHMLEAMALETPVIACSYSGNMEFCDERATFLVPYRLVPVGPGEYPRTRSDQLWAEPDFARSVEAMKTVFGDRAAREAKVAAARAVAETRFSPQAFARRLDARIAEILARRE